MAKVRTAFPRLGGVHFGDLHPCLREFGLPPALRAAGDRTYWGSRPIPGLSSCQAALGIDPELVSISRVMFQGGAVMPAFAHQ
eukprot:13770942-Alexandrium_andersonii.AAC.1